MFVVFLLFFNNNKNNVTITVILMFTVFPSLFLAIHVVVLVLSAPKCVIESWLNNRDAFTNSTSVLLHFLCFHADIQSMK